LLYPNRQENLNFLGLRYVEDMGYCSVVRKGISQQLVSPNHYFLLDGKKGQVVNQIKDALKVFIQTHLEGEYHFEIKAIYSPWNRMFETGLEVVVSEHNGTSI
ncbi:MAG: hypothetical protein CVV63_04750, partial [Tenericutes bacterium HGW-Tenericutes-8]